MIVSQQRATQPSVGKLALAAAAAAAAAGVTAMVAAAAEAAADTSDEVIELCAQLPCPEVWQLKKALPLTVKRKLANFSRF